MSKKNKKEQVKSDIDKKRYEYMIAWRERYISKQKEVIEGLEEEERMLTALLAVSFGALLGEDEGITVTREGETLCVSIEKAVLRHTLDRFSVECRDEEHAAAVRFTPREDVPADTEGSEAASAETVYVGCDSDIAVGDGDKVACEAHVTSRAAVVSEGNSVSVRADETGDTPHGEEA